MRNLSEKRIPVRARLTDNSEVEGIIEFYDVDFIRLTRDGKPNLFLYKHDIKYLSVVRQRIEGVRRRSVRCCSYLETALEIAREASALVRDFAGRHIGFELKGEHDLVTAADRASEKLIVQRLQR